MPVTVSLVTGLNTSPNINFRSSAVFSGYITANNWANVTRPVDHIICCASATDGAANAWLCCKDDDGNGLDARGDVIPFIEVLPGWVPVDAERLRGLRTSLATVVTVLLVRGVIIVDGRVGVNMDRGVVWPSPFIDTEGVRGDMLVEDEVDKFNVDNGNGGNNTDDGRTFVLLDDVVADELVVTVDGVAAIGVWFERAEEGCEEDVWADRPRDEFDGDTNERRDMGGTFIINDCDVGNCTVSDIGDSIDTDVSAVVLAGVAGDSSILKDMDWLPWWGEGTNSDDDANDNDRVTASGCNGVGNRARSTDGVGSSIVVPRGVLFFCTPPKVSLLLNYDGKGGKNIPNWVSRFEIQK
jgi:hypothetical protein